MDNIQDYESWNEGSTPSSDTRCKYSSLVLAVSTEDCQSSRAGSNPVRTASSNFDFLSYLLYNIFITLDNNYDNLPTMQ